MAKKLNLSTKEDKVYGEFTKGYRLSDNVIDRRGKQAHKPTETPKDGFTKAVETLAPGALGATPATEGGATSPASPQSSSRKASAEEAIRRTHTERD